MDFDHFDPDSVSPRESELIDRLISQPSLRDAAAAIWALSDDDVSDTLKALTFAEMRRQRSDPRSGQLMVLEGHLLRLSLLQRFVAFAMKAMPEDKARDWTLG